jgi:hypothetical protein
LQSLGIVFNVPCWPVGEHGTLSLHHGQHPGTAVMNQLAIAVLATVLGQFPGERDFQIVEDEKILKAVKVRADGESLLDFLRQQTLQAHERESFAILVKRLDDKALSKRDKAALDITALGAKAIPVLRQALPGATLEMRMRLERCIKVLEKDSPAVTAGAAVVSDVGS